MHPLPTLDRRPGQVGVHAPVPVSVVDDDDDRERRPEALLVEAGEVRIEGADPADEQVEAPPGGEDDTVVGRRDSIATEGGDVDPVVESLTIDDPGRDDRAVRTVIRPRFSGQT
jgi:hypothetical protein